MTLFGLAIFIATSLTYIAIGCGWIEAIRMYRSGIPWKIDYVTEFGFWVLGLATFFSIPLFFCTIEILRRAG